MKINQHIEIVRSDTAGLSSMSQKSCAAIAAVLAMHYVEVGVTIVNTAEDLESLLVKRPDLVFLGMKFVPVAIHPGLQGTKIWLTDFLDEHNIAYTGSDQRAHELEFNKPKAKQRVLNAGLNTSAFCEVIQGMPFKEEQVLLTYPLFVKPTDRGGGMGIDSDSVVWDFGQLQSKVESIADRFKSDALVEEYLPGREFSVAILKREHSSGYSAMPLELVAPPDAQGHRYLSASVKSADSERFMEVTDGELKSRINGLALDVFHALGARDYGRIDIRLNKLRVPQFLEANLIPSLLEGYGNFPKACTLNLNLDYQNMLLHIVRLGLLHNPVRQATIEIDGLVDMPILDSLQPLPETI